MKILVLVQDYPSIKNKYAMNYVHTRNLEYVKHNLDILVLSFAAPVSYEYEGIKVISLEDFKRRHNQTNFNLVISHAPNLRNHIKFLKAYDDNFKKILFFIHGHEVMRMSKYYPEPYPYQKTNGLKELARDGYDLFKLRILRGYFTDMFKKDKVKIIFVSNWMRDVFYENIPISQQLLTANSYIVSNSMNTVFLEKSYSLNEPVKADFITIRPLDNPKYAVDLVVELAEKHPNLTFHLYGKGEFFSHNIKPDNVEVFQEYFDPDDMAERMNHYRCALLPTRLDAQGVLMCEAATYGMPLVTSNLPICKEMLGNFNNIFYFDNNKLDIDLDKTLNSINLAGTGSNNIKETFSSENTILKELEIIHNLI